MFKMFIYIKEDTRMTVQCLHILLTLIPRCIIIAFITIIQEIELVICLLK